MRILCYGDSNTYGWDPRDYLGMPYARPWPTVLAELLAAEVISMGEPGREIPGARGTAYLLQCLETERPDLLMILLGTNDLLHRPAWPVEQIASKMEALVTAVRSHFPEMKVVLLSPPPMSEELAMRNGDVRCLAEAYHQIVIRCEDDRIKFLDISSSDLPLAFDGIHLTEEGHAVLAGQIDKRLRMTSDEQNNEKGGCMSDELRETVLPWI